MEKILPKVKIYLTYLLILLLPTQLGKHFWPDFSYLTNLRIDYLSPTLYITDIIIFSIFILSVFSGVKNNLKSINKRQVFIFPALLFYLSVVSFLAISPALSFIKLAKIFEFIFLGLYFYKITKKEIKYQVIIRLLLLTATYESLIAIWQFITQSSIGGAFWLLGERSFNASTPFIAQAIIDGQIYLRAYGTFSHPNVLGAYLVIVLSLATVFYQSADKPKLFYLSFVLGMMAIFFTFSRNSWVVFGLFVLFFFARKHQSYKFVACLLVVLTVLYALVGSQVVSRFRSLEDVDKKSLVQRQELNTAGLNLIRNRPLLGVGLNNFLLEAIKIRVQNEIVRSYQPVHNIYLLIASESGIPGLMIFGLFVFFTARHLYLKHDYLYLLPVGEILFLGLFDHYFYTLQQGQLLFSLVFGLSFARRKV